MGEGVKRKLTGAGNGLAVALVLDVAGGKDTLDARHGGAGLGLDVAILVHVELALDEGRGGVMADGVEEAARLDDLLLVASTEINTDDDRAAFVAALQEVL